MNTLKIRHIITTTCLASALGIAITSYSPALYAQVPPPPMPDMPQPGGNNVLPSPPALPASPVIPVPPTAERAQQMMEEAVNEAGQAADAVAEDANRAMKEMQDSMPTLSEGATGDNEEAKQEEVIWEDEQEPVTASPATQPPQEAAPRAPIAAAPSVPAMPEEDEFSADIQEINPAQPVVPSVVVPAPPAAAINNEAIDALLEEAVGEVQAPAANAQSAPVDNGDNQAAVADAVEQELQPVVGEEPLQVEAAPNPPVMDKGNLAAPEAAAAPAEDVPADIPALPSIPSSPMAQENMPEALKQPTAPRNVESAVPEEAITPELTDNAKQGLTAVEDILTMSQAQRDAEIRAMLADLEEGEEPFKVEMKESPVVKSNRRVPPYLLKEQENPVNRHLSKVYTQGELNSMLLKESMKGNINGINGLLHAGLDINLQSPEGATPLLMAARNNQAAAVKLLIMNGADVNLANAKGQAPMHFAAYHGSIEIIKLLLNASANVNIADEKGTTPLHTAVMTNQTDAAKLLILKGAEVNTANSLGHTPLHIAASHGNQEIINQLLRSGANTLVRTASGLTPADIATRNQQTKVIASLNKSDFSTEKDTGILLVKHLPDGKTVWTTDASPSKATNDTLEEGKWYADVNANSEEVWFKYRGTRPNALEHPRAQESWKYSQDKDGKWYVYNPDFIKFGMLDEAEKQRWNQIYADWQVADKDFNSLTDRLKREWKDKYEMLKVVFPDRFTSEDAEETKRLAQAKTRWKAVELLPAVPVIPVSQAEIVQQARQVLDNRTSGSVASVPNASLDVKAGQGMPPIVIMQSGMGGNAEAQAPQSMAVTNANQASPVFMTGGAIMGGGTNQGDTSSASQIFPMATPDAAYMNNPVVMAAPGSPAMAEMYRNYQGQNSSAMVKLDPIDALEQAISQSSAQQFSDKLKSAAKAANVTQDAKVQIEAAELLSEWEVLDKTASRMTALQKSSAEKRRQQIAKEVLPGGAHSEAFSVMPDHLQQGFITSMKRWDAEAPEVKKVAPVLEAAYVEQKVKLPTGQSVIAESPAQAVTGAQVEEDDSDKPTWARKPKSIRWAQEHTDIIPAWKRLLGIVPLDAPVRVAVPEPMPMMIQETPAQPATMPDTSAVQNYTPVPTAETQPWQPPEEVGVEQSPYVAPDVVETSLPESVPAESEVPQRPAEDIPSAPLQAVIGREEVLNPLDSSSAAPEDIQKMLEATQELRKKIQALGAPPQN